MTTSTTDDGGLPIPKEACPKCSTSTNWVYHGGPCPGPLDTHRPLPLTDSASDIRLTALEAKVNDQAQEIKDLKDRTRRPGEGRPDWIVP